MIALVGTVAVLIHAVIVLLHGIAHSGLGIELSAWQETYAAIVIVVAPVVAAAVLWTRHARLGLLLLAASMAGSLLFGLYHHYLAVSPDHVSHLPPGEAQGLFRLTALLMAISEVGAVMVALWGVAGMPKKA